MSSQILQKILKESSDPELVRRAFEFAQKAHRGQKRVSGEDYIVHPLKVAEILTKMRLDPQTVAAGLLHDIPDDTSKALIDIEKEFGKEVAFLVEGVSKLGKLRYLKEDIGTAETREKTPIDLKAENLRKMFFATALDLRVVLIKLADRLHNMQTLSALPLQDQQRIALETLEIFAPITDRLGIGEIKDQLEDLSFPHLYPKECQWLKDNLKERMENGKKYLKKIKPILVRILKKEGIKPISIDFRVKNYWSFYKKLLRKEKNFDKIYDLIAFRIIVKDTASCYKTLGILHKYWKPLLEEIGDFIALPKPNGYQSLHTTCFCPGGKLTEFQIRTPEMHQAAEYGICAHWAYKQGVSLEFQQKKFAWINQLRDWQKGISNKEFLEGLKIDFFKNRIFVFTPKGDVVDLPEEATPVDFAYAVHTEIGKHCSQAKVNEKITSLSTPLKNGSVVEIITNKNRTPSRDWLEFVKTSLARSQIKEWLRKESEPINLKEGLEILNQELKEIQGISWNKISKEKKNKLLEKFAYQNIDALVMAVGKGDLSPREIFGSLFQEKEIFRVPQKATSKLKEKTHQIAIGGQTGMNPHLARCCLPQPGENIKAYITKTRGATVHKIECQNLKRLEKRWPQKTIRASWLNLNKILYPVSLKIKVEDRVGLLKDVSSAISSLGINILSCQAGVRTSKKSGIINLKVEVSNFENLEKIFEEIKQIKGVIEIKKD